MTCELALPSVYVIINLSSAIDDKDEKNQKNKNPTYTLNVQRYCTKTMKTHKKQQDYTKQTKKKLNYTFILYNK